MALAKCRSDIYENGDHVCVLAGVPAAVIEAYVKAAAKETEQDVDWHYVGGRANVLTTGDAEKVREWVRSHKLMMLVPEPIHRGSSTEKRDG
jgi:hypothetical protein